MPTSTATPKPVTRGKVTAGPVLYFVRPPVAKAPAPRPIEPDKQRVGRMAVKVLRLERLNVESVILVEQLLDELIAGWVGD